MPATSFTTIGRCKIQTLIEKKVSVRFLQAGLVTEVIACRPLCVSRADAGPEKTSATG
jgi:hypothetical protein